MPIQTPSEEKTLSLTLPAALFPAFVPGSVWLTGAGPGDPALLTLLGLWGLREADVILHDALLNPSLLELASPGTRFIDVGKRMGKPSMKQEDINSLIISEAQAGHKVLRLKGGDPFIFARGGEEAERLADEAIPFRVIPGITSGIAALTYAGIPSTHRDSNQSITYISAHDRHGGLNKTLDWNAHARVAEVLVIYMGSRLLPAICERLLSAGRSADEPLAIISRATWPDQQTFISTLGVMAEDGQAHSFPMPALIVLGSVVTWQSRLNWLGTLSARHLSP